MSVQHPRKHLMVSGIVVGRTGRYRVFPIVGTAVMALGLYLMSTIGRGTGVWRESLYLLIARSCVDAPVADSTTAPCSSGES